MAKLPEGIATLGDQTGPRVLAFMSNEKLAVLVVLIAPVIVKIHLLTGMMLGNPIYYFSGLAIDQSDFLLPTSFTIDPNIGFISQAMGHLAAVDVLHGTMPWWDPYEGAGAPLAGEMQSAPFFPLTLLLYFRDGQLYEQIILQIVAGIFTFLLLRRLQCRPLPALAGALAFEFNGSFAWLADPSVNPIPFLPVMIYGVESARAAAQQARHGGWFWVSAGLALSIYAGFPEMAYFDGLLVACWCLLRLTGLGRAAFNRFFLRMALATSCGFLLALPGIIAFLDYLPYAALGGHGSHWYLKYHTSWEYFGLLFLPYLSGGIDNVAHPGVVDFWNNAGGYGSVALTILAVASLAGAHQRGLRFMLLGWVIITVCDCYGVAPVVHCLSFLPGFSNTIASRYVDPSWEFALSLLAAFAIDDLMALAPERRATGILYGVAVAALLVLTGLWLGWTKQAWFADAGAWADYWVAPVRFNFLTTFWMAGISVIFGFLLLSAFAVLALLPAPPGWRARGAGLLLAMEMVGYFLFPTFGTYSHAKLDLSGVDFLRQNLGTQRFYALDGLFLPNYGSYFGLASINMNDLPAPILWIHEIEHRLDPNADGLLFNGATRRNPAGPTTRENFAQYFDNYQAVGVKYLVALAPFPIFPPGVPDPLTQVYGDGTMHIYQLPKPRPYFSAPGCALRIESRARVIASCPAPAPLLRLELFMPGWRVSVDGHDAAVTEDEGVFQSVALPAGVSKIRFAFEPPYMMAGYIGFAAGLVLLLTPMLRRQPA